MKTILALTSLLIAHITAYGQSSFVPYRVGDKFGISDADGKMQISAQFDIIDVQTDNKKFFTGYTFKDGVVLSSAIYNNKIILRDKNYRDYRVTGNVIKASVYSPANKRRRNREWGLKANIKTVEHLYGIDGKRILDGDYESIYIYDEIANEHIPDELLINTIDTNDRSGLLVYNMKTKQVTKTYFSGSKVMRMVDNDQYDQSNRSLGYIYQDANGKMKKIVVKLTNKKLSATQPVEAQLPEREAGEYGMDGMTVGAAPDMIPPPYETPKTSDSVVLQIAEIKIARDYYYAPKKVEHINETRYSKLSMEGAHIVIKNGKKGMKIALRDTFVVQPKYDEIFIGEFSGQDGGYVLKTGTRYGLYIYNHPKAIIIEPVFDKRPLLADLNYFKKGSPLIKLYDEQGNFFCYADGSGKLFYKEK